MMSASAAAFTATDQTRRLETTARFMETLIEDAVESPDLGLFDESISSSITNAWSTGVGTATQSSEVTNDGFRIDATISTQTSYDADASALSEAAFVFTVTAPTQYILSGSVRGFGDAMSVVELTDSSGMILESFVDGPAGSGNVQGSYVAVGFLAIGEYQLAASSTAVSDGSGILNGGTADGSIESDLLLVPEPSGGVFLALGLAGLLGGRTRAMRGRGDGE